MKHAGIELQPDYTHCLDIQGCVSRILALPQPDGSCSGLLIISDRASSNEIVGLTTTVEQRQGIFRSQFLRSEQVDARLRSRSFSGTDRYQAF